MTNDLETIKKQASNIDEHGNVLYLDEERLNRKENGFTPYKNKSNGLGIWNAFKEKVSVKEGRWEFTYKLYKMFVKFAPWMKKGGLRRKIYRKGIMLDPPMESHTSTIIMPLDVDITDESEKVVVPMDLIKEAIRSIDYVAGMKTCLCRNANECEDYPRDIGCLFFGEGAKTVVRHGLAERLTDEEAFARVDKAAEYGLMGQAVWIEVEQILWGVRNDELDKFVEVCFCCPCCCIAMRLARDAMPEDRRIFHPSGWTAVPDRTKCTRCGKCSPKENGCPVEAISFDESGKVLIDQEICVGCGICKDKCDQGVIKIKQTMPMRKDLHEYFLKDYNLDIKLWDNDNE